jgi:hypothetical protein
MSERSRTNNENDLVRFAGPIFDLILRLKAGIVQPSNDLRPKCAKLLAEFEKRAERYRFCLNQYWFQEFLNSVQLSNAHYLLSKKSLITIRVKIFS